LSSCRGCDGEGRAAMPQEVPAWKDYGRTIKTIRKSTLGKKSSSFESMSELDELFAGFDGADKTGKGTLSLGEVTKGLIVELKDRTRLKNSDNLVVESVEEAIRRGFHATKNLIPGDGRADQLEHDEFRAMLIYMERFFELLQFFKVVELEKGKPASTKSGGDERPVFVYDKEFAQCLPMIKAWGVSITGRPNDVFAELSKGAGKMGFDAFAHWALQASLDFLAPEESTSPGEPSPDAEKRKARAMKYKKEMEKEEKEAQLEREAKQKMAQDMEELAAKSAAALQSSRDALKARSPSSRGASPTGYYLPVAEVGASPSSLAKPPGLW